MAKKSITKRLEVLKARAQTRGYEREAHQEADEKYDQFLHGQRALENQENALQRYILWQLIAMTEDHERKGLAPPDEVMVRDKYLKVGMPVPNLATVKDFLRFYILTSRPRLADRPTVVSMKSISERFYAGFQRVTGAKFEQRIPHMLRQSI